MGRPLVRTGTALTATGAPDPVHLRWKVWGTVDGNCTCVPPQHGPPAEPAGEGGCQAPLGTHRESRCVEPSTSTPKGPGTWAGKGAGCDKAFGSCQNSLLAQK